MATAMETYYGYVENVHDALLIFEACRLGQLRRVQRRLSDKERRSLRSGSVYVWEEEEASMKRWTDGRTWSPSRVHGCFLTYRELENKRKSAKINESPTLYGYCSDLEQSSDHFQYKSDGLIKQSLCYTTANGHRLHLISYHNKYHVATGNLRTPAREPSFAHITIPKGLYPDMTQEFSANGGFSIPVEENFAPRNMPRRPSYMRIPLSQPQPHIQTQHQSQSRSVSSSEKPRSLSPSSCPSPTFREYELPSLRSPSPPQWEPLPPLDIPCLNVQISRSLHSEDRRQLSVLSVALTL
ncbi:Gluconate transport-inducing protein [Basidiobolus ranarum]|uniref:Gluconate transport-inducing protein n=1 Tax=Basidiobolus ranarum TaxID=34480 RepID=A0ABR2WRM5_9FUNG